MEFYCVMICHYQALQLALPKSIIQRACSKGFEITVKNNKTNLKFKCIEILYIHPPALATQAATATVLTNSGKNKRQNTYIILDFNQTLSD